MGHIDTVIEQLKPHAKTAAGLSYSPYSKFPVGAAVVSSTGGIYRGCNIENASFGLTQCAERSAMTAAVGDGVVPGTMTSLLIYTPGNTAHAPCGACRQVMHELMTEDALVVSCCDGPECRSWISAGYLPDPFGPESLLK